MKSNSERLLIRNQLLIIVSQLPDMLKVLRNSSKKTWTRGWELGNSLQLNIIGRKVKSPIVVTLKIKWFTQILRVVMEVKGSRPLLVGIHQSSKLMITCPHQVSNKMKNIILLWGISGRLSNKLKRNTLFMSKECVLYSKRWTIITESTMCGYLLQKVCLSIKWCEILHQMTQELKMTANNLRSSSTWLKNLNANNLCERLYKELCFLLTVLIPLKTLRR